MPPLTSNKNTSSGYKPHYRPLLLLMAVVAALSVFIIVDKQNIYDWWKLRGYTPPSSVVTLAKEDTMTSYALKVFEVNHPAIENKTAFSVQCPNDGGEKTIVLGCYHSGQDGIFILNVSDPVLNGVEQVTAAHEMLHAAYERLSSSERSKVDTMLLNYYHNDLKDPRIISTINAYKKSEPDNVVNEMHSVFGTEVASLPASLEQYYRLYFSDRQKITSYAAQYEAVFTSRQAAVNADDQQLTELKPQIDSLRSSINTQLDAINTEESR
jgi:hypothetical protein